MEKKMGGLLWLRGLRLTPIFSISVLCGSFCSGCRVRKHLSIDIRLCRAPHPNHSLSRNPLTPPPLLPLSTSLVFIPYRIVIQTAVFIHPFNDGYWNDWNGYESHPYSYSPPSRVFLVIFVIKRD